MGFWWFVGIVVAVALGVSLGLRYHDNPNSLSNDLSSLWALISLLLLILAWVGLVWGAIFILRYFITHDEFPARLETTWNIVGSIIGIVCGAAILYCLIRYLIIEKIKKSWWLKKWWFKKRWKSHKSTIKEKSKKTSVGCLKYTWIIIWWGFLIGFLLCLILWWAFSH